MNDRQIDRIIGALQERAKELNCLYAVHELLSRRDLSLDEACNGLVERLPAGWQFPSACWARVSIGDRVYQPPRAVMTPWVQRAPVRTDGRTIGAVEVFYTAPFPPADEGPFLKEERKLIDTIAERLGEFAALQPFEGGRPSAADRPPAGRWPIIVDFLGKTDVPLLARVARRMITHLALNGVEDAQRWLQRFSADWREAAAADHQPAAARPPVDMVAASHDIFSTASRHLSDADIDAALEKWVKDENTAFLVEAVEDQRTSLADIGEALERYERLALDEHQLSRAVQLGLRVSLARRFLSDDLAFIDRARRYVAVADYCAIARRVVSSTAGHGRLGGKSAGLLLAHHAVRRSPEYADVLGAVRVPRTWYLSSDAVIEFIRHNQLDDVYNRKYLDLDQIRREYPHIVEVFRHAPFPADIGNRLAQTLDELGDLPLIVRSSSLLEDRTGAAFSGKYKSLFLTNQGSKAERLAALREAIAEVFASLFAPDPIAYRAQRGLLDHHEEMAILIQEVVGTRLGDYFFPAFAGVAFSHNEFRWSPRVRRADGLVRLVAGLGTRAVDRMPDDYPVLAAPAQPQLRVNVTPEDVVRYAPRKMDVLNLRTGRFETADITAVVREHPQAFPMARQIFSVWDGGMLRPLDVATDCRKADLVVTFEGLFRSGFLTTMGALLRVLSEKLEHPVDIEFASDGVDLFLLQCRAQSHPGDAQPERVPRDLPRDRVLFTANRHVSNGRVPDLTHLVYVDPVGYRHLHSLSALRDVGRAVAELNRRLPARRFALIGPGRWGSRGDVTLGVPVTYSDISHAAALIELAVPIGGRTPDLSFGTHFFQDLIESSIRYLPLYPDDPAVVFNTRFFEASANLLAEWFPAFAALAPVIRVIDVPAVTGGLVVRIVMDGERDEAAGFLVQPGPLRTEP